MKSLIYPVLFALCVSIAPNISAIGGNPAIPLATEQPAATVVTPGEYVGEWRNESDSGTLSLMLKQNGTVWNAEASFTFQGEPIAAKVTSLAVKGGKIELVFSWNIQGTPGQSRLTGELTGNKLEGSYQSETPAETTSGTWAVTRA